MRFILVFSFVIFNFSVFSQWQNLGDPAFSAGQVQYTSVAVEGANTYVAYRDMATMNKCSVMKFDGSVWSYVGAAGISAGGALYTSLAIDNGFPFVAYVDGMAVNRVTVKAFDGTNWVNVGTQGFTGDNTSFVNLEFDGSTPYVAYQDGSNGNKVSVMRFNSVSWEQVGTAGFSADIATNISFTIMSGTPYVAFKDADASDELSVMYFDGASWQYLGSQGITSGGVGKISASNDGTSVFVAFEDPTNADKITVMKYNGTWQLVGDEGFSPGAADFIDLEFLGGEPYVAYQDASYGFRANVMRFDGTDWVEFGNPGFTPSQAAHISLDFKDGYPLISYQDYDGGTYKASVMIYEPCFDADMPTLSLSETTICKNMPLTLSVTSGNLNSANHWAVYTGGCGTTLVGTFTGANAILFPQGNTTYFVRGEPHCINPLPCSSIAVTVTPIDSSVMVTAFEMTAVSSTASNYEWLNCNMGYSVIPSENNQTFTPANDGNYALKISENGCIDTSSCYTFSSVNLDENDLVFEMFPNPSNNFVTIEFETVVNFDEIIVTDFTGKTIISESISGTSKINLDFTSFERGIYFVRLKNESYLSLPQKLIIQ